MQSTLRLCRLPAWAVCVVAVVLLAAARVGTPFAANSGWYTMVDDRVPIPYGMADAKLSPDELRATFTKDLVVLLGEEDNNPTTGSIAKRRPWPRAATDSSAA